jgi:aldose 1-epimerase
MGNRAAIVELRAGHAVLGVAPAIGGSLVHYRWIIDGATYDWLRPATPVDLAAGTADRLACFPLIPFSNRVRDSRFAFGKHLIRLPLNLWPAPHARHGHGWQAAWQVIEQDTNRMVLEFLHVGGEWPFPYRAQQHIALTEKELRLTLSVENCGSETMPIGLGLHPYFPRTSACRLSAHVAAMWATDHDMMPTTLVAADARLAARDGLPVATIALDNVFAGWQREATIVWPEGNCRLAMTADPPLDFLVIYSPRHGDFFCAEPVSHCTDAFNLAGQGRTDTGMLTLEPGARLRTTVRFRPTLR